MKIKTIFLAVSCMFFITCGSGIGGKSKDGYEIDGDIIISPDDEDGDTISDEDEDRLTRVDTDGDGTPDYQDQDSDDDTIPDLNEAGDGDPGTDPIDSDSDGVPNFRDTDSDNNGILDAVEGMDDTDSDGKADFADLDNDGDGISDSDEIGPSASSPLDSDSDGIFDYMDFDSDNDTIRDMDERNLDSDSDGTPNFRDHDSDNDTIPDEEEAGDDDLNTPPVDTDGDFVPDFIDRDSDSDGLSDAYEYENHLDPTKGDTDEDGTTDLIEVGAGTDPLDASSNPRSQGDFVFVIPFLEDPIPPEDTLVFTTDLQKADVYFLIDTSGSMDDEVFGLRDSLRDYVVPNIRAEIPDVWFGLMRFEDCPWDCGDTSLKNLCNLTGDIATVEAALNTITDWCGGWEPYTLALYIAASGDPILFPRDHARTPKPPSATPVSGRDPSRS